MEMNIPLGQWLPDLPAYGNPGLVDALNTYPTAGGYGPMAGTTAKSATTTETATAAKMFFDNSSNAVIMGGSSTRLWTDRSGTVVETSGYSATTSGWGFERYKDLVIATSIENLPQYLTDIGTDNTWSALSNAPKASQVGRVEDFLVIGDISSDIEAGTPTVPHRLRWSARNDPTASWTTSRSTLANYQDLDPKYGKITAIAGGRFGLVFQQRAIRRMVFTGAPQGFDFPYVATDVGCIAPHSAVTIGAETYFLNYDGFYRTDGSTVVPIGGEKVNNWFIAAADPANIDKTHGTVNWTAKCVMWAFYPAGGATYASIIMYNFVLDKWSWSDLNVDYLVQTQLNAQTLGTLAALYPGGLGTMSAFTLGTSAWQGKSLVAAAYITSGSGSDKATLDGPNLAASFLTADAQITPGYRSEILGVWPGVESNDAAITTSIRSRARQGGIVSQSAAAGIGADGFCPHKVEGALHAISMNIPASSTWDNASNLIVRARRSGKR